MLEFQIRHFVCVLVILHEFIMCRLENIGVDHVLILDGMCGSVMQHQFVPRCRNVIASVALYEIATFAYRRGLVDETLERQHHVVDKCPNTQTAT